MEIQVLSETKNEIRFNLLYVTTETANTLRRIITSEIPTVAISTCLIDVNSSFDPDETLAHRLGLVPVVADPHEINAENVVMHLDVRCEPGQALRRVFSRDLIIDCPGIRLSHPNILLAKLAPGQELKIRMCCAAGTGRNHAKWSPVTRAFYGKEGNHFVFTVESVGALDAGFILREALDLLQKQGASESSLYERL